MLEPNPTDTENPQQILWVLYELYEDLYVVTCSNITDVKHIEGWWSTLKKSKLLFWIEHFEVCMVGVFVLIHGIETWNFLNKHRDLLQLGCLIQAMHFTG